MQQSASRGRKRPTQLLKFQCHEVVDVLLVHRDNHQIRYSGLQAGRVLGWQQQMQVFPCVDTHPTPLLLRDQ